MTGLYPTPPVPGRLSSQWTSISYSEPLPAPVNTCYPYIIEQIKSLINKCWGEGGGMFPEYFACRLLESVLLDFTWMMMMIAWQAGRMNPTAALFSLLLQ